MLKYIHFKTVPYFEKKVCDKALSPGNELISDLAKGTDTSTKLVTHARASVCSSF